MIHFPLFYTIIINFLTIIIYLNRNISLLFFLYIFVNSNFVQLVTNSLGPQILSYAHQIFSNLLLEERNNNHFLYLFTEIISCADCRAYLTSFTVINYTYFYVNKKIYKSYIAHTHQLCLSILKISWQIPVLVYLQLRVIVKDI